MDNYLTVLFQVHSMTTTDMPEKFTAFLNKHAEAGYSFRYAIRIKDGQYLMIFEKVVM